MLRLICRQTLINESSIELSSNAKAAFGVTPKAASSSLSTGQMKSPYQRRSLRGARGLASLTVSGRPSTSAPFMPAIAACASLSLLISTKPKPRERPVSRSMMTCAESTDPNALNAVWRLSFVVLKDRLPTKIFNVLSSNNSYLRSHTQEFS